MYDSIAEYLLVKRASGRAAHTVYEYGYYLRSFADYCDKPLASVTNLDVATWIVRERDERGLAPASVYARFRALRIYFNWCVENELLVKTPIRMKAPRIPKLTPRVATIGNVQRLLGQPLKTWLDYRDRALISLLLDTGMRIGEACSLTLRDVDMAQRIVHVPAGKNYQDRYAPFTPESAEFVTAYLAQRPSWATDESLFLRMRNRGRLESSHVVWMLTRRSRRAEIAPYVNAHSLRHLFAVKALNDGIRVEVVSRILGHANVDFTLKVYARLMLDTIRREYDAHWRR